MHAVLFHKGHWDRETRLLHYTWSCSHL